jgi:hypothetical protein
MRVSAEEHMPRWLTLGLIVCAGGLATSPDASAAQQLRGRVVDATNGAGVSMAAVRLVDRDREHISLAVADSLGRYFLSVPDSAEYVIVVQRFGYQEFESPLLAISSGRDYDLDLELQPQPLGLGGVTVTVRNEELIDWLRLELGYNPVQAFGFRVLQGARLEEAKARAANRPTETLRWLYIPVSHGSCVSINHMPRAAPPARWGSQRGDAPLFDTAPSGVVEAGGARDDGGGSSSCGGTLMLNDREVPNELIDTVDMSQIAVVVTLGSGVRLYTYDFDWRFRRP